MASPEIEVQKADCGSSAGRENGGGAVVGDAAERGEILFEEQKPMLIEKDGSQVTEFDLQAQEQHLNKIRITPFEHGHVEKEEEPMEDTRYDDEEKHSKSYAHSRLAMRPFLSRNPRQRNTYIENKPPIDLIEQRLQRIVE